VVVLGVLITAAIKLNKGLEENKALKNDPQVAPIVKLLETSSEDFIALLDGANIAIQSENLREIQLSLEDLEAKRPQFEDSLFKKEYYESLEKKGFYISDGEKQVLFNMKSQYDTVVQELNYKVAKAQSDKIHQ
jgi:hypothetical protein